MVPNLGSLKSLTPTKIRKINGEDFEHGWFAKYDFKRFCQFFK